MNIKLIKIKSKFDYLIIPNFDFLINMDNSWSACITIPVEISKDSLTD